MKKKILVFSGAGVSREAPSNIKTFRDSADGLWNEYKISEVATSEAWENNTKQVIDFYNLRRNELKKSQPNKAHEIISELEKYFDVNIITQNVDNLHELAGSTSIIHLHGNLTKGQKSNGETFDLKRDIELGDVDEFDVQIKPNVVLFGDALNEDDISRTKQLAKNADVCIIVGTSMKVAPANGIPFLTPDTCLLYYVDPGDIDFYIPTYRKIFFNHIKESATSGMEKVKNELLNIFEDEI